jgi:fumarate hydratase class II
MSQVPSHRTELDAFGEIQVPQEALWGPQTQRSLQFFAISRDQMGAEMLRAFILIKSAAAEVNAAAGRLPPDYARAIMEACQEILAGNHLDQFPVSVWQTGSGTQFNMNVNEVLANRAIELLGARRGHKQLIHPNDHVNLAQSSNDTFPSAMHIATVEMWHQRLRPVLQQYHRALRQKAQAWAGLVKIGRTHLQDAVPLTLGQEFSGYAAQIAQDIIRLDQACEPLYQLALGATAVGTGVNCPPGFSEEVIQKIALLTGLPFIPSANRFASLASHDDLVAFSAALRTLAVSVLKITADIAWLSSGPRCGLGELELPANEPGSSIMPGKVNPTQCEALSMVAVQVMGLDAAVAIAGSRGNFELNVYKPLIIFNILKSIELLSDSIASFVTHALSGLQPNREKIHSHVQNSLMLVTALAPRLGYDRAAQIAKEAHARSLSLRQAAIESGLISAHDFDHTIQALLDEVAAQGLQQLAD